jgi:hypothetical protein
MHSLEGGFRRPPAKSQPVIVSGPSHDAHSAPLAEPQLEQQPEDTKFYAKLIKREVTDAPITEAGRVVYLEESSNMSLLVNDYNGPAEIVHYPMHGNAEIGYSVSIRMDKVELSMLR